MRGLAEKKLTVAVARAGFEGGVQKTLVNFWNPFCNDGR